MQALANPASVKAGSVCMPPWDVWPAGAAAGCALDSSP